MDDEPVARNEAQAALIASMFEVGKINKDIRQASRVLSEGEARFLVDAYYDMQANRIRSAHQERQLDKAGEPNAMLEWFADQNHVLEEQVRKALDAYSAAHPVGVWMRSITGIGPVIAAGFLAHIDIKKAPGVGNIWRYAGLDPTMKWEKGKKRPWNARLKVLCWKLGESFVKVSNNPNDVYGKVYADRKRYEIACNEAFKFADQAAASLAAKKFGADTEARKRYEAGKLPDARLHLRAQRYAVKLFLSHLHHVWYEIEFNVPPARPYILNEAAHLAHPEFAVHTNFIAPPNWPMK